MAEHVDLLSLKEASLARVSRRADGRLDSSTDPSLGLATGISVYALAQGLVPQLTRGSADELAAVGAGAAVSLLPLVGGLKHLCHGPSALKPKVAAGVLGASAGAGFGGLIAGAAGIGKVGLALTSLVDGGITLGLTLLVGAAATWSVTQTRHKVCPGLSGGPQHRGDCQNRICPRCHIFYFPDPSVRNLDECPDLFLSLAQVYSYLQYQGLDIFDSACLIKDSYKELVGKDVALINPRNDCLEFERSAFARWVESNAHRIAGYRGYGSRCVTPFEREGFVAAMNRPEPRS
jgi:hypothetical protein